MSGFRQTAQEPESERPAGLCAANGCRMRGTVNSSGQWLCFMHDTVDWRVANDVLRANERIVLAIDLVRGYGEADWKLKGWPKMVGYFNEVELQPTEAERNHRTWYEYRLHNWLLHLAGACAKPIPREPMTTTQKFNKAVI